MRRFVMLAATVAATLAGLPAAAEDRAVAVVERSYDKFGPAAAPDADALFGALRQAGMRVASGTDLGAHDLRVALDDLSRPDPQPGGRIVVLTGKFINSDSDTWLLARDAAIPSLATADLHGMPLSRVVDLMRDGGPRSVLLLGDASGGVGPAASLREGIGPIGASGQVHVIAGPPQAVSAAATALSRHGTTVAAVLRANPALRLLQGGGGEIAPLAARPTAADPQRPVVVDPATGQPVEPSRVLEGEAEAWVLAAARHSAASYEAFLRAFPEGRYAQVARTRLTELGGTVPPVVAPAPQAKPQPQPQAPLAPQLAEMRLNLSQGERTEIQRHLTRLGYDTKGIDGIFGSGTRAALTRWQRDNGRPATGYLDAETVSRLRAQAAARPGSAVRPDPRRDAAWQQARKTNTAAGYMSFAEKYPGTPVAAEARKRAKALTAANAAREGERKLGLTPQARMLIERRLTAEGMKIGKADGSFDAADRQAIRAYQRSRDLPETGFITEAMVGRLLQDAFASGGR